LVIVPEPAEPKEYLPGFALASAARQQWLADLGVKERLGAKKTEDRAELVRAIRATLGK